VQRRRVVELYDEARHHGQGTPPSRGGWRLRFSATRFAGQPYSDLGRARADWRIALMIVFVVLATGYFGLAK
jgi:hypothetical protein